MNNETIGKILATSMILLALLGIGSTFYNLLCDKDAIELVKKQSLSNYYQKN